eukprot:scaffold14510_cov85-Skeletonema_menzelii.AAC.2
MTIGLGYQTQQSIDTTIALISLLCMKEIYNTAEEQNKQQQRVITPAKLCVTFCQKSGLTVNGDGVGPRFTFHLELFY